MATARKSAPKSKARTKTAARKTAAKKPTARKTAAKSASKTASKKTAAPKAEAKPSKPRAIAQPVIRRIWPLEADAMRRHLCRLDRDDRTLRFGRPVTNRFIQTYVDRIDWFRDIVIGAVVDGEVTASGILTPIGWRLPLEGSAAVAVESNMQGYGLGSELTKRMLTIGRNRFMSRIYMLCLVKNERMYRIAEKFGGEVDRFRDETVEAQFDLSRPTVSTVTTEAVSEGLALGRTVVGKVPVIGALANGTHAA
ncbi:Histone acetyltransferase HPA2 and related acetyltransferases [Candidatus Phaeomarinobacter ectocarpi]|uniref:Histone acetyltransferase HPA2 and related acetyltransferases n=1 Tax=Candidatus Phaeomarinibacter ectocarpi TaxID=1458461 RepID=X5ME17_9HYPH|nr:GNAT family N-acetyltransferase [Candidatus Phaeomarinobacter ectocarpi]CDO60642.1 Histone acetyltransferase HPA2 and related acetyltransferases [Candidatus Phaeomarinobacter ectocarpi]